MYSELLAEAFDADVVGVDPSIRMREVAQREHAHPRVRYVEGNAERIPLGDASCDVSLLSQVAHHIADQEACARELWRVIRPSGSVLVRGILPESLPSVRFLELFPAAAAVAALQAAALAHFLDVLAGGGFRLVAHEAVEQESAPGLPAYYERVKLRAISTLELIDDADFEAGVERLRQLAERESEPEPVIERIDLAVLQRS
jgi:ubiquinone/menaquinone biosynthesis C-methylase UbiE